jgi:hypothetical protein
LCWGFSFKNDSIIPHSFSVLALRGWYFTCICLATNKSHYSNLQMNFLLFKFNGKHQLPYNQQLIHGQLYW